MGKVAAPAAWEVAKPLYETDLKSGRKFESKRSSSSLDDKMQRPVHLVHAHTWHHGYNNAKNESKNKSCQSLDKDSNAKKKHEKKHEKLYATMKPKAEATKKKRCMKAESDDDNRLVSFASSSYSEESNDGAQSFQQCFFRSGYNFEYKYNHNFMLHSK